MSTHIEDPHPALDDVALHLRTAVAGAVHAPGTGGYDLALAGFNLALVHRPVAVVVASNTADVAAAVRIAASRGLTVAVQSTGHGAEPTGPESIVIVTGQLTDLTVDPAARTATVGAGVRWQQVLDAAATHGLAGLCGSAPGVGVVGYTVGGGIGPISRSHGFAADHVVEFEVVTADGEVRTVAEDSHPDLFFALRGGGAAFGIVTRMTFRLFPIRTLNAGGIFFDIVDARRVLHGWREWAHMLPESVTTSVAILNLPPVPDLPEPIRGRTVVHVRYAHTGNEDDTGIVAAIRSLATPLIDTITEIPYAAIGTVHADPTEPMPVAGRSVLLGELPVAAIDTFLEVVGPAGELPITLGEIRMLGGALARPAAVPNAVGGRSAAFSVFTTGVILPPIAEAVTRGLDAVLDAMAPWSTGGSLMNFDGDVLGDPAKRVRSAWGGDTLGRLLAIRDEYDPKRVFAPAARW